MKSPAGEAQPLTEADIREVWRACQTHTDSGVSFARALLARAALATHPAPAQPTDAAKKTCVYCDGTGDIHRRDGEWMGRCPLCTDHRPAGLVDNTELNCTAILRDDKATAAPSAAPAQPTDEAEAKAGAREHDADALFAAREASAPAQPVASAARDVLAERQRQVEAEGWTAEHDDAHGDGSMAAAGACYAMHAAIDTGISAGCIDRYADAARRFDKFVPDYWPWGFEWWKPTDPRRMLVKAGALILAEIERLDRAAAPQPTDKDSLTVPWPTVTRYSGGASHEGIGGRVWVRLADDGPEVEYMPAAPPAAQPVVPAGWQAIETAPKDGRKLILFYRNSNGKARTVMAKWVTDDEAAETDADDVGLEGGWYECIDNWDDYCQVAIHEGEPTHWMPLPAAPSAALVAQPEQPLGDAASGPGSLSLRSDDPYRSTPTSEASRDL